MAKELARGDDASMQLIDMLIDQNDGEIDDRTLYLVNKVFNKRSAGARAPSTGTATAAPAAAAPSAAPSAPTTGGTVTSQPAPGATITRLLLTTVKPGDLITAGFMNDIIAALLALDNRLALLEKTATTVPATGSGTGTGTGTTTTPSDPKVPAPVIKTAEAITIANRGVFVTVKGKGLSEGLLETVLLGSSPVNIEDTKKFEYTDEGFAFRTTQPVLTASRGVLKVVTKGGRDTAEIARPKTPID